MKQVKYRGFNHIALVTSDMDKTLLFWRDLIGLRLVAGIGNRHYRQYFFELSKGQYISFFQWSGAEPVEEKDPGAIYKGPIVFDHICLEVQNEDDLWDLKARLEAQDIWVTEVLDHGFIYSFFTTDPNNINVEICFSKKDLSEIPRMTDPNMSDLVKEGPEPQLTRHLNYKVPSEADRMVYPGELKKLYERKNLWNKKGEG